MAVSVGDLEIRLFAEIARLRKDMNDAKAIVASATKDIEKMASASTRALSAIGTGIRLTAAVEITKQLVGMTDEYIKFTAQLKIASTSTAEFNNAIAAVSQIARTAQTSLGDTGVLFARITNATRQLSVSQKQVSDITETVALSLRASGATAKETASATLQLSQAFGSGVLRGALLGFTTPLGLVLTALTAGAAAWALYGNSADEAKKKAAQNPSLDEGMRDLEKRVNDLMQRLMQQEANKRARDNPPPEPPINTEADVKLILQAQEAIRRLQEERREMVERGVLITTDIDRKIAEAQAKLAKAGQDLSASVLLQIRTRENESEEKWRAFLKAHQQFATTEEKAQFAVDSARTAAGTRALTPEREAMVRESVTHEARNRAQLAINEAKVVRDMNRAQIESEKQLNEMNYKESLISLDQYYSTRAAHIAEGVQIELQEIDEATAQEQKILANKLRTPDEDVNARKKIQELAGQRENVLAKATTEQIAIYREYAITLRDWANEAGQAYAKVLKVHWDATDAFNAEYAATNARFKEEQLQFEWEQGMRAAESGTLTAVLQGTINLADAERELAIQKEIGTRVRKLDIELKEKELKLDSTAKDFQEQKDRLKSQYDERKGDAAIQARAEANAQFEIDKQRQLAQAQTQLQTDAWREVDSVAQDTFRSIFDGGKDTFQKLRDELKNTLIKALYQMTVQRWLINLAVGIGGQSMAENAFGVAQVNAAQGGGFMNLLSGANSAYNAFSGNGMLGKAANWASGYFGASTGGAALLTGSTVPAFSLTGMGAGAGLYSGIGGGVAGGVGGAAGTGFMAEGLAGSGWGIAAGSEAVGSAAAASTLLAGTEGAAVAGGVTGATGAIGGAMAGLAAAAPYIAAAVVIASMLMGKSKPPTTSMGDLTVAFDAKGNVLDRGLGTFAPDKSAALEPMVAGMQQQYAAYAQSLGVSPLASEFFYGANVREGKLHGYRIAGKAGASAYDTGGEIPYSEQAVADDAARAVLAALQGTELPTYLRKWFDTLVPSDMNAASIGKAVEFAQSLKAIREQLTMTPLEISELRIKEFNEALGTNVHSVDEWKTQFLAAIDAGTNPEAVAKWQSLGQALDAAAQAAAAATEAEKQRQDVLNSAVTDAEGAVRAKLKELEDAQKDATQKVQQAESQLRSVYRRELAELTETANKWRDAAKGMREYAESIFGQTAAPSQTYAVARARFMDVSGRVQSGDADTIEAAIGQLRDAGESFKDASADASHTRFEFVRDLARIGSAANAAAKVADAEAAKADQSIAVLRDQVSKLIDIDGDVVTVEQAINELQSAAQAKDAADAALAEAQTLTSQVGLLNETTANIRDLLAQLVLARGAAGQPPVTGNAREGFDKWVSNQVGGKYWLSTAGAQAIFSPGASDYELLSKTGERFAGADVKAFFENTLASGPGGGQAAYNAAVAHGIDLASLNAILGLPAGTAEAAVLQNQLGPLTYGSPPPGYATGINFVPQTGPAILHQGERVISRAANDDLINEIRGLREDLRAGHLSIASATQQTAKLLDRWDGDGMPDIRDAA